MSSSSLLKYEIVLHNPTGIYKPGDQVTGHVALKILEDIPLHGVQLWVFGQSDVSWADKPDGRRTQFEYEVYMQDCLIVWGKGDRTVVDASEDLKLPSGSHEFPFEYTLPTNIPSSFESHDSRLKGRIHYLLRTKLDSSDANFQLRREKIIIVLQSLDLNKEHTVKESIHLRKEKKIRCSTCSRCCCSFGSCCDHSGTMSCSLRLDRTGYVPGEDINLDAEVQNLSSKEIAASYVTMQQVVQIRIQNSIRCCASDIFRISGGKLKSGDSAFYHDIIHIPPLPPSRLDWCNLIHIDYLVTVGVLPTGMTSSFEVSQSIIVGTIPLNDLVAPGVTMTPSFSRYSHSSGEIEDYTQEDYRTGKYRHVYKYYKCLVDSSSPTT